MRNFVFTLLVAASAARAHAACGPHLWDVPVAVGVTRAEQWYISELMFQDLTRENVRGRAFLIDGGLGFLLELDDKSAAPRALYGRDVFRLALHEFGDRVRFIRAHWLACRGLRDNLDQFNAATARGLAPGEAARATWTGRMSARFGFTVARQIQLVGEVGHYTEVRFVFERPPAPPRPALERLRTSLRRVFSK